MTEVSPAPVGVTELLPSLQVESARARIDSLKSDTEFYKKLVAHDPVATAEWDRLHKEGWPAPVEVTSSADVENQVASRNERAWNEYFSGLKQKFNLTPENEAELRGGVVRADVYQWAQDEKARLIKDKGFYRRLMDGDRAATNDWTRITLLLSLRPVKAA